MRITKYFLIIVFSLILRIFQSAADLKIGYVDIAYILNESPAAKAAQKKLEQEFTPRNKQLEAKAKKLIVKKEKLQKESDIMSKDQIVALQRKDNKR